MKQIKLQNLILRSVVMLSISLIVQSGKCVAQNVNTQEVYFQSWKKGDGKVLERTVNVSLGPEMREYEIEIANASGQPKYKLLLLRQQPLQEKSEFWKVELREILNPGECKMGQLGDNLLSKEGPGPSGDNFPREDLMGFLYPKDNPRPYVDSPLFYPMTSKRIIQIEKFTLSIQVYDYQMNTIRRGIIDSLVLIIELRNTPSKTRILS